MALTELNEDVDPPRSIRTKEFPESGLFPLEILFPFHGRRENISYAPEISNMGVANFRVRYCANGDGSASLKFFITKEEAICINELLLEQSGLEDAERRFRIDLAVKLPSLDADTLNYIWSLYTASSMGSNTA